MTHDLSRGKKTPVSKGLTSVFFHLHSVYRKIQHPQHSFTVVSLKSSIFFIHLIHYCCVCCSLEHIHEESTEDRLESLEYPRCPAQKFLSLVPLSTEEKEVLGSSSDTSKKNSQTKVLCHAALCKNSLWFCGVPDTSRDADSDPAHWKSVPSCCSGTEKNFSTYLQKIFSVNHQYSGQLGPLFLLRVQNPFPMLFLIVILSLGLHISRLCRGKC